jgi:hypothetical protein
VSTAQARLVGGQRHFRPPGDYKKAQAAGLPRGDLLVI